MSPTDPSVLHRQKYRETTMSRDTRTVATRWPTQGGLGGSLHAICTTFVTDFVGRGQSVEYYYSIDAGQT